MAAERTQANPHGVATAVVFDWALTVQLTTQAIAAATGHLGLAPDARAVAGRLAAAGILLALGEALRRGVGAARLVEAAIVALISLLGLASAGILLTGHGDRSLVPSTVIELTVAPWLVWALLTSSTRAWFAAGPRRRPPAARTTGHRWLLVLAGWSVTWGVAVAWSQSL